ncbi:MAG: hydrogenase expression/formation protein HypE [Planctomycetota bacterium]
MEISEFSMNCPSPLSRHTTIQMAHGGGGRLMRELIEGVFLPAFASSAGAARHDSSVVNMNGSRLAFTTDSYVVHPLFFPGGDIGKLAVYGTVNDLAMSGARPLYLSASFILEEGFSLEILHRVVRSMRDAAKQCAVEIVTGDTKVVDRGKGDGVFITTAGMGIVESRMEIAPRRVQVGDVILLSGDIGRHGIAIMSAREGLAFDSLIESDCAPLAATVGRILDGGMDIHCMRDLTRGGLASALNEIATDIGVDIEINDDAIPVHSAVRGACEILGLDPYYVANEGRFVVFVPQANAADVLAELKKSDVSKTAVLIGCVTKSGRGAVVVRNSFGLFRLLDLLSGEQLPRIC